MQLKFFLEYFDISNVHGARYVNEKGRNLIEKIFWILMLVIALLLSTMAISAAYRTWKADPVIITFAGGLEPTFVLPAPAVTICPNIKSFNTPYNLAKTLENRSKLSPENRTVLATMLKICENTTIIADLEGETISEDEIYGTLVELKPVYLEDLFTRCAFAFYVLRSPCFGYVAEVLTEEGICYTYNGLNALELWKPDARNSKYTFSNHERSGDGWTVDEGYADASLLYPSRSHFAYYRLAMTFLLNLDSHNYDPSCVRNPGFKVALHSPAEIPSMANGFINLPVDKSLFVVVKPHVVTTADELRTYDPEVRQCYFNNEKFLRYYKMYTLLNCQTECLSNHTAAACGCVEFYMPRSTEIPICGLASRSCTEVEKKKNVTCNCLPGCNSLRYDTELMTSDTFAEEWPERYHLTMLSLTYKWNTFMPLKRSAVTGPLNFVANSGSLLGLLMGVSFLSVVELLYHFTIRLMINLIENKVQPQ